MLKALNWHLCPETPISWLKLYAQVGSLKEGPNFLVPQFSQEAYIQMTQVHLVMKKLSTRSCCKYSSSVISTLLHVLMYVHCSFFQLLDLCILDINSLDYQYGVLAAAAFCHFTSIETVQKVSGKNMNEKNIILSKKKKRHAYIL